MRKKLLVIVMSLTMILAFMPATAFAVGQTVVSIAFAPAEQKIAYDYYLEDKCEMEDGDYLYGPVFIEGDSIEITYDDNTTVIYKLAEDNWVNENDPDDVIPMDDFSFSSARIPASAADGDAFTFEIVYSNVTTTGTVIFKKSNVSSITYTPKSTAITLYEGVDEINETDDAGNVVTYFDVLNAYDQLYGYWNDKVTIEYNDGTPTETLDLEEFRGWDYVTMENGEYVSLYEAQQGTSWAVGDTYKIFLKAKGKVDTANEITIEIETSPYTAFAYTQSADYLYVFDATFESELEYDSGSGEYVLRRSLEYPGTDGDKLSFTLKDGSKVEFEYGRIENDPDYPDGWDGLVTTDANGNKTRLQRTIKIKDTELRWKKDSDGYYINNTATLTYMGVDSAEHLVSYVGCQVWFKDSESEEDYANFGVPIGMSVNDMPDKYYDSNEPSRSGYIFSGWYEKDPATGELKADPYDFNTKIEDIGDGTFLYAKWEECEHNLSNTEARAATCTEDGNIEYWTCAKCGMHFSDAEGTTEISENDLTIPATGHSLTHHAATEATTTAEGSIEYWTCSECGRYFSDAAGETEITKEQTVIAKKETPTTSETTELAAGDTETVAGSTVEVVSASANTVTFTEANKSAKSVTVPATVTLSDGESYEVTGVAANAFKGTKATSVTLSKNIETLNAKAFNGSNVKTITVKTTQLTKKSVKNSLKGSKVKTVKVKVGKKAQNKTYVKKYKKFFTKKNAGKKVKVK